MVVQVVAVGRARWWLFYRQLGVSARINQQKLNEFSMQHDQESRTASLLRDQVRPSSFGSAHVSHQALITSSLRKPSRESRMLQDTRGHTSIPGNVFDCQPARRVPEELHNDSRNLATPSGIQRREGIEKSWSEKPLQSMPLPYFSVRAREKGLDDPPCRGYWDLHSKWHDNSELLLLGDASGKIA